MTVTVNPEEQSLALWWMADGCLAEKRDDRLLVWATSEQACRTTGEDVTDETMFEPANKLAENERLPLVSGGDTWWS